MYIKKISTFDTELRQERESNSIPFSKSPFVHVDGSDRAEILPDGELQVKVATEDPWTDLLLEVAMTTAFASLTDGTPILTRRALLSYLSFFILVWWIWTSQVAYNLRFRQSDWLHRIYVFLQLAIFSALAAFTRNFDITAGLLDDDDLPATTQLLLQLGDDENNLQAFQFRDNRLPKLNARGIAMTMALSRLLLLVQYIVVCYHGRRFRHRALVVHMLPLVISTLCFVISFGIIGSGNEPIPKSVQISKIILWYFPMVIEIVSYFIAHEQPGRVAFPAEGIIRRSATVFIITLGGGLDKITAGFQLIIGNTGLGVDGIGVFISAAVIFVSQFSLYFGSSGSKQKLFGHRATAWFFSHFFYLAALIMTLQGVSTSLSFSNINHAIQAQTAALTPVRNFMQSNPGINITAGEFPDSQITFEKLGLSFPGVVSALNTNIELGRQRNDSSMAEGAWLQQSLTLIDLVLQPFDADPQPRTLLWAKLQIFLTAPPNNTTEVNVANWWNIYDGMVRSLGSSVLWFYPAAGSTLVALAFLSLIRGRPRDAFELASVASRLFFGVGVLLLSLFDIHSSIPVVDGDGDPTSSMIWRLTWNNWVLPLFAIAVGGLSTIEFLLAYFANRQYYTLPRMPFKKEPHPYNQLKGRPFDPYYQLPTPTKAFIVSTPSEASFYMGHPSFDAYGTTFHYANDRV